MKLRSFSGFILGLTFLVSPTASSSIYGAVTTPLHSRVLKQFPGATWIENTAVRPNGALLLTILSPNASLYQLSDPATQTPALSLLHTFSEVDGLLGITETSPDVFVVVGAKFNPQTGAPLNGSTTTFSVDLNKHKPAVRTIATIPEAVLPNGLTSIPHCPTTVLISDSFAGLVWRLDTLTGHYDVLIQTPEMSAGVPGATGINGLHIFQDKLYFVNSFLTTLYRVKITRTGSISPLAKVEVVAKLEAEFLDDFAMSAYGTIYLATNRDNRVIALKPDDRGGYGEGVVVVGSATSLTVAGDTAAAFGRTASDREVLYVVTSGTVLNRGNETVVDTGKVVAVDTKGY